MSVLSVLLASTLALASPSLATTVAHPVEAHGGGEAQTSGNPFPGAFDRAPVHQWRVRLPGPRPATATHTERTRPILAGSHIYVGSAGGQGLHVLSRRSGSHVRTFPAAGTVESEPVVTDERVYFADTAGSTWCYTREGDLLWRHRGTAPVLVRPTVTRDRVYVATVDDLVVALDPDTGELDWRYRRPADPARTVDLTLYAATPPVLVDGELILGFSDGALVALDAERGDVTWERRLGEGRYPDVVAGAVAWGDDVFAGGYLGPFAAVDRETQNIRWRVEAGAANQATVDTTREDPILYHPGTDGILRAVAARTGAVLWRWDSETSGALTTPEITPAGIVVGSSDGQVYLVDPETGAMTWRFRGPILLTGVTSAPSVDGRQMVLVSNAGYVHSFLAPRRAPERPLPPYPASRLD